MLPLVLRVEDIQSGDAWVYVFDESPVSLVQQLLSPSYAKRPCV